MNAYQAQRIRFGILAARHTLARGTMTPDQVDYLEGCRTHGWIIGDAGTLKAYDRECRRLQWADRVREIRHAAWQDGYWAGVVDERTSEALQLSEYGPNRVNPYAGV